jgi:SAM-dependent methyltransferase
VWRRRRAAAEPPATEAPAAPVAREDYRDARLTFLKSLVDLRQQHGLELGALDFPTVLPDVGRCDIADLRSSAELSRMFGLPIADVAPVTWVLERGGALGEQIPRRYDYVILCHVLEHVPDPIGFLNDVATLLRPGGIALLAIPDKRRTLDATRPPTTVDELLARHYQRARSPSLAAIMEFARTWLDTRRELAATSPREFYAWAVREFEHGLADVHCNVWRDVDFFEQLDYLVRGGFLPDLEVRARKENEGSFNEFYVALRSLAPELAP